MHRILFTLIPFIILGTPLACHAQVISEVMWMGTDLSSSDEWLEISNPSDQSVDIGEWKLMSLQSSGQEAIAFQFPSRTIVEPNQTIVIARFAASDSRLFDEPTFVVSSLTLPNTKLLLRLLDAMGAERDTVDDSIGSPFAGANPSGGLGRASMQRIDLFQPGNLKENWKTADVSVGFDSTTNFGSPGTIKFTPLSSSSSEQSSSISSSETSSSESSSEPPLFASLPPPESPTCRDTTEVGIVVQSGELTGVGKTSVNFQAVALSGSLTGITCSWQFSDGFTSSSCNPPSHSFTQAGETLVHLEAINKCGNTMVQELSVTVIDDESSGGTSSQNSIYYDGSKVILTQALPNPEGADTGKEWIELKNMENRPVNLDGWKIKVGETSVSTYALKGTIAPNEKTRVFSSEVKFSLPNSSSKIQLVTPAGQTVSTILWKTSDEERAYLTDDIRELSVTGKVVRVTGGLTFDIESSPQVYAVTGEDIVHVRLLGLKETGYIDTVERSIEKIGSYEVLTDLLKDQKVELEFDTELWDAEDRLLAYVFLEGSRFLQPELLVKPYWDLDDRVLLKRHEHLESVVKSANKILVKNFDSDLTKEESLEQNNSSIIVNISFSEVYPAPFPKSQAEGKAEWQLVEWIELKNNDSISVDLSGYWLSVNDKKKAFKAGTIVEANSYIILPMSELKLSLLNNGSALNIKTKNDQIVSSMNYPKIKLGQSYALNDQKFCTTDTVTPEKENECFTKLANTAAMRKLAAAKTATKKVLASATSYKKQVEELDEEPKTDFTFPEVEESSMSNTILVLVFVLGLGLPIIMGIFAIQHGWIVLTPEVPRQLVSEPTLHG